MKKKDQSIETIRGLALLLMVIGHVIGQNDNGMRVSDDSFWSYLYFSLMYIRMPLYTVISGYVYALRPVEPSGWKGFMGNKIRRLIVPLLFVSTIQYLFQAFIPSVNTPREIEEIWRIYLFSYSHFWYLQALLIVFILITLIDYNKWFDNINVWLIGLFVSFVFFLFPIPTKFFSLQQVSYLLPFFLLGYGLCKFPASDIKKKPVVIAVVIIFIVGFVIQQISWFYDLGVINKRVSIISLVVGVTGTSLLMFIKREVHWLAYIGKYSYTVYLWHVFATAGSRIFLENLINIKENLVFTFIVGLLLGSLGPIYFEKLVLRNRLLSFLCLGTKLKKKRD